ncbi:MAG: NAD(P)H-hydrate dehydratase [Oscillospiraceae bacterium]
MLKLTKNQMQLVEKLADQNGLSYKFMMQNAGSMAYKYLQSKIGMEKKKCVILAGNGNNAGDGFVMARLFSQDGIAVTLIMCMGVPLTPLSIEQFELLRDLNITIIDIKDDIEKAKSAILSAEIIIDAIFGIGFHGELNPEVATIVTMANDTKITRISLDIPSGTNADSGEVASVCFHADLTLSFAAYKYAHSKPPAKQNCGVVEVLDIGIPSNIIYAVVNHVTKLTAQMIADSLPVRKIDSNKGDFGKLLNISGCASMGGAAMMSTLAAMRIGVGIVRLATPRTVATTVASHLMEAMTCPLEEEADGSISMNSANEIKRLLEISTTCLIGCGISVTSNTKQLVEFVIKNTKGSLVLDADALNCIVENVDLLKSATNIPIITPHIGEMARLVGMSIQDVIDNSVDIARVFSKEYNVVVVLKSHKTLIATPTGEMFENITGNAGLSKGGSGDVLAGMISGLLAQGFCPRDAAICGVYLHGDAADSLANKMSLYSMLARDVINEIPYTLKRLDR